MNSNFISKEIAQKIVEAGIVEFKGFSGVPVDVATAAACPSICQLHAMSGNVYDLRFDGDKFELVPYNIVYEIE
jgi:hypothetical protein